MGFADVVPRIFSIGSVPINPPYRYQMVSWRFRRLDLRGKYDFFIVNGDWAVSGAVNNKPNLWYVNATIREIWDLYGYVRKNNMPAWKRPLFDVWAAFNRRLNKKHVAHVGAIASNSTFTKERVKKYLGRESTLAYPPISTKEYSHHANKGYWLSVNRLISYKRVDMQLRAFAALPEEKLVIVGPHEKAKSSQDYVDFIYKMKPANVTIIDHAENRQELADLYSNCKGFMTTCHHEDFGMTAVEAMASGKFVIAPNEGGYRETVIDGETGALIDNIDETKLAEAVKKISSELEDPMTRREIRAKMPGPGEKVRCEWIQGKDIFDHFRRPALICIQKIPC